jgi:acetyl-CoA C-acetyltransferase
MTTFATGESPDPILLAAGLRTPQARVGGRFAGEDAGHLGSGLVRELLARSNLHGGEFDEVLFGCVSEPPDQTGIARVIARRAGIPTAVPACTLNRNCGSGLEAVIRAVTAIGAGVGNGYLCGGVEVVSAYPPRMALREGLTDPLSGMTPGAAAEELAREFGIAREAADAFALRSHRRAARARQAGRFDIEIMPWLALGAENGSCSAKDDDGIEEDACLETLAREEPCFVRPDGTVTAGNSCGMSDGATALIICTSSRARELELKPLARIRAFSWVGLDAMRMGLAPVHASSRALDAAGLSLEEIDVIELHEAFAAQVLACGAAFGELDPEKLNRNGGAIALGHPLAATGARLLLTAAHELRITDGELALVTLGVGDGQGGAVILERYEG